MLWPSSRHNHHPGRRTTRATAPAFFVCWASMADTDSGDCCVTVPNARSSGIIGPLVQVCFWAGSNPSGTARPSGMAEHSDSVALVVVARNTDAVTTNKAVKAPGRLAEEATAIVSVRMVECCYCDVVLKYDVPLGSSRLELAPCVGCSISWFCRSLTSQCTYGCLLSLHRPARTNLSPTGRDGPWTPVLCRRSSSCMKYVLTH